MKYKRVFVAAASVALVFLVLNSVEAASADDAGENAPGDDEDYGDVSSTMTTIMTTTSSTVSTSSTSTSMTTTTHKTRTDTLPSRTRNVSVNENEETEIDVAVQEARVCGNTDKLCPIEYDLNADGRPDCCNRENNPMCENCLIKCRQECSLKGVGVKTCFHSQETGVTCDCSDAKPTCYDIPTTTTIPAITKVDEAAKSSAYVWVALSVLLAGSGAIIFLRYVR